MRYLIISTIFLFFLAPMAQAVFIIEQVPFISQAPFGNWEDLRQQEGCEEASAIMSMYWAKQLPLSNEKGLEEILALSAYQEREFGHYHDTSLQTTYQFMKGYFQYEGIELAYDVTINDIQKEIDKGHVIMAPMLGRELKNPNFTSPGPLYHMIVIFGYDDRKKEFITHDPGTRRGKDYRYPFHIIEKALLDYPDGYLEPLEEKRTGMIVVKKQQDQEKSEESTQKENILKEIDKERMIEIPPSQDLKQRPSVSIQELLPIQGYWKLFMFFIQKGNDVSKQEIQHIPIGIVKDFFVSENVNDMREKKVDIFMTRTYVGKILVEKEYPYVIWYVHSDHLKYKLGEKYKGDALLRLLLKQIYDKKRMAE